MKTLILLTCAWVLWSATAEAQTEPGDAMAACLRAQYVTFWRLMVLTKHKDALVALEKAALSDEEKLRLLTAYWESADRALTEGPPKWGTRVRLRQPTPEEIERQREDTKEVIKELREAEPPGSPGSPVA